MPIKFCSFFTWSILFFNALLFFFICLYPLQAPTPGPYVKDMQDAGMFYTNRVLKEYKDK